MKFEDIKNKIKRKFRSFHIGTFGAIVCSAQLILELYNFALNLFINNNVHDVSSIIFLVINCVFDLYLVRYFILSKENNTLTPARTGIILLVVANYVLPAIEAVISSMFTNSLGITLFSTIISGMVLGIIYFVLLILEYRHVGKHNHLIMAVVSGLMVVLSLLQGGTLIAMGAMNFISATNMLYVSLSFIYLVLSAFVTIGISVIFLLYPLFAIRESRRGY